MANMEDVLDLYCQPYDPELPVVCMDEKPYQLLADVREPLSVKPSHVRKEDSEYERKGTCSIFVFTEPLRGFTHTYARQRRTKQDWAHEIRGLLKDVYPTVPRVRLVCDSNTHVISSLYEAFPAREARTLARRLEIHYTPKHGSWLNIAEIELNVMTKQCLGRRIPDLVTLQSQLSPWEQHRNASSKYVDWQFDTAGARDKLKWLYPKL